MSDQLLGHRPASADDLDEVVRFVRNADELFYAFPRAYWPFTREQLAAAFAERRGSTLALLDGRPAGFANFYQSLPGDYCALGNLMIAPWARGQGVARYLIGVMERLPPPPLRAPPAGKLHRVDSHLGVPREGYSHQHVAPADVGQLLIDLTGGAGLHQRHVLEDQVQVEVQIPRQK